MRFKLGAPGGGGGMNPNQVTVAGTFRIAINKLSGWLFSRLLASHAGAPCSITRRDMSVPGPLD
jgi:hypothetical protein